MVPPRLPSCCFSHAPAAVTEKSNWRSRQLVFSEKHRVLVSSWRSGGEALFAGCCATVRNRPQPSATVRNRPLIALCAFHEISRDFTDFQGGSRPFAGISRSFHEISRPCLGTPLSRPLGGFTAIFPRGTRPPKTRSYACLGCCSELSIRGVGQGCRSAVSNQKCC